MGTEVLEQFVKQKIIIELQISQRKLDFSTFLKLKKRLPDLRKGEERISHLKQGKHYTDKLKLKRLLFSKEVRNPVNQDHTGDIEYRRYVNVNVCVCVHTYASMVIHVWEVGRV